MDVLFSLNACIQSEGLSVFSVVLFTRAAMESGAALHQRTWLYALNALLSSMNVSSKCSMFLDPIPLYLRSVC